MATMSLAAYDDIASKLTPMSNGNSDSCRHLLETIQSSIKRSVQG
jgi:hypothetical protein